MTQYPLPPENKYEKKDRLGIGVFAHITKMTCCSWDYAPDQIFMPELPEILAARPSWGRSPAMRPLISASWIRSKPISVRRKQPAASFKWMNANDYTLIDHSFPVECK